MLNNTELLVIPEDLRPDVPCVRTPALFTDPALDIDVNDSEWLDLSRKQQQTRLDAKVAAEARAVAACATCPMLAACSQWVARLQSREEEIFGVVAGTTQEERTGTPVEVLDLREDKPRGADRHRLIAQWTRAGISISVIAKRLGVDERTVERHRARMNQTPAPATSGEQVLGVAKSPARGASRDLDPARVSPQTAAIYTALVHGAQRDRDVVVESVMHTVDRVTALARATAGRTYASEDAKAHAGARKFLMNRIDIAVRTGRVIQTKVGDRVLISLDAATAAQWREHLARTQPTAVVEAPAGHLVAV